MSTRTYRIEIVAIESKNPSAQQLVDSVLFFQEAVFAYQASSEAAKRLGIREKGLIAIHIDNLGRSSSPASAEIYGRHFPEPSRKPNLVKGHYTLVPVGGYFDITPAVD